MTWSRRQAAALSANEWNDAVGAAAVAAVLDFQHGARVIPFPAEDGRGEKGGLREDVAGQNFGGSARERHAVPRCRRRRNRALRRARKPSADGGMLRSERVSMKFRDLRLVRIADDPRDAGKRGEFFGCALSVAAGDDDASGGVFRVNLADGIAGLGIGGGSDGTGVHDNDVARGGVRAR